MVCETRRIFGDDSIMVKPTTMGVLVFCGHSEAVHVETRKKITAEAARKLFEAATGVEAPDIRTPGAYPMAVAVSSGQDGVFVGRIREHISHPRGLNLWVLSDNMRKGA